MSYAVLTLCIVFMVNLFLFLAGSPEVNSPMLAILSGVSSGSYNIDWTQFFTLTRLIQITAVTAIILVVSNLMNPTASLTGNFNTFHVMTVLAISVFISFLAVPNFGAMGIPEPANTVIQVFFGFLVVLSMFGLFKGGN